MNNLVLTCIYNEEHIIKLFLTYYNSFLSTLGSGTIMFVDFGCTDNTIRIINQFKFNPSVKVEIINNYTTEHREDILMLYRNHYWKRFKNQYDYVFIVDADELIYDANLIENLQSGIDYLISEGFDVITDYFKPISKHINKYDDIKLFMSSVKPFINLNKINVFNPKTFHPNYNDGCHIANPVCKIPFVCKPTFLIHFKWIGYNLYVKNASQKAARYLTHSAKYKHGYHYTLPDNYTSELYEDCVNKMQKINLTRDPEFPERFTPTFCSVIDNFKNMFS